MRIHKVKTAAALGAVALLAAAMGGTASAAPSAGYRTTGQPTGAVLVDCVWHTQVRPADFLLACGDGNNSLSSLRWSHWDPGSATATGINVVNDCKPYCAAGKFHSYPVIVRLDRAQPWTKHPQLKQFTQLSLVYTGARPEGSNRVVSYPLWD
ncbi:hypothetical protein ACIHAA_18510 [Streptomyces sp. NPDC052040]|uniref:hypothetical protein n=1 Tax=unclassified Streptomyces TaxID=2593676 RepID=UPI0037D91F30